MIAATATDAELGAALNKRLDDSIIEQIVVRRTAAQEAREVREDADAAAVATQFVAMSSFGAPLGRRLDGQRLDAVVEVLMRGSLPPTDYGREAAAIP